MNDIQIINLIPENIADYGVCAYKDVQKHLELRKKIDWSKEYYPKGLRIKVIFSEKTDIKGCWNIFRENMPIFRQRQMDTCLFTVFLQDSKKNTKEEDTPHY